MVSSNELMNVEWLLISLVRRLHDLAQIVIGLSHVTLKSLLVVIFLDHFHVCIRSLSRHWDWLSFKWWLRYARIVINSVTALWCLPFVQGFYLTLICWPTNWHLLLIFVLKEATTLHVEIGQLFRNFGDPESCLQPLFFLELSLPHLLRLLVLHELNCFLLLLVGFRIDVVLSAICTFCVSTGKLMTMHSRRNIVVLAGPKASSLAHAVVISQLWQVAGQVVTLNCYPVLCVLDTGLEHALHFISCHFINWSISTLRWQFSSWLHIGDPLYACISRTERMVYFVFYKRWVFVDFEAVLHSF